MMEIENEERVSGLQIIAQYLRGLLEQQDEIRRFADVLERNDEDAIKAVLTFECAALTLAAAGGIAAVISRVYDLPPEPAIVMLQRSARAFEKEKAKQDRENIPKEQLS